MDLEIDPRDLARVAAVATASPGTGIGALAALAGLDPARDLVGHDLRGWALAGEDLRGFDLSRCDLRGTGIERSTCDGTTILDGARLDRRAQHLIGLAPPPVRRGRPPAVHDVYTKVRIPDLSDAELLDRRFVVDDPLSLENVVYVPPPNDQWLTYEGRYDVDAAVVCAFGHRHKKGYVFRDEGERRYLVGNSCGAKHLGMGSWKVFAKGRELLEERASYLRELRDLNDVFARNRDWMAGLRADPSIAAFDETRSDLLARHPALVRAVERASANGGRVQLSSVERDFEAEERVREEQAKAAERRGLPVPTERPVRTRTVLRDAGVLHGRSVFTVRTALRAQLGFLVRFVDAFLERRPVLARQDLVSTTRNARALFEKLFAIVRDVDDFVAFFDPGNLRLFMSWAEEGRFDGCRFSIEARGVDIQGPGGHSTTLGRPPSPTFRGTELDDLAGTAVRWGRRSGRA